MAIDNEIKMSKRITATGWTHLKRTYPDDVSKMHHLNIPVNRFNVFLTRALRRKKLKKLRDKEKITNVDRYGQQLGYILDRLHENCNDMYYVENEGITQYTSVMNVVIYFMVETDAMAFKLMFE